MHNVVKSCRRVVSGIALLLVATDFAQSDQLQRSYDIMATKAGLAAMGFLPNDTAVNDEEPDALRDAVYFVTRTFMAGLQTEGRAAHYALETHGIKTAYDMYWRAMYGNEITRLRDTAMAREIVATGLEDRFIDFATLLEGSEADIAFAEALAYAINPAAGISIDGVLDQPTIDTANAHIDSKRNVITLVGPDSTNQRSVRITPYLQNGHGNVYPAVLFEAAKYKYLQVVPEDHFDPGDLEEFIAIGEMDTLEGREFLSSMINRGGGTLWYAQGLAKIERRRVSMTAE